MIVLVPMLCGLFVLFGCATAATTVTPALPSLNKKERECFLDKKVLYHQDGKCYDLRTKGPCQGTNQWLVMDIAEAANGTLKSICKPCPCCAESVRLSVFWPEDRKCHNKITDKEKLCPYAGTDLDNDPFGDGECTCTKDPPHVRHITEVQTGNNKFSYGPCYKLYGKEAPCPRGQVLVSAMLPGFGRVGKCEVDKCASKNANSTDTYAYHALKKKCYKLDGTEPCEGLERFKVSSNFHQPQCLSPGNAIFNFHDRCEVSDATNKCVVALENKEEDQHSWVLDIWNKPCRKRSTNSVNVRAKCNRGKY